MVFGFFSRNVPDEEKKIWNNDERPSYKTTRARFKIHKQIRDGNVPVLKPVVKVIDDQLYIATYKKGSIELYERQEINSPSASRGRSPSREEGEVIISDTELRPHYSPKGERRIRRKRKRRRTNSET
jgi:hypothetical protein